VKGNRLNHSEVRARQPARNMLRLTVPLALQTVRLSLQPRGSLPVDLNEGDNEREDGADSRSDRRPCGHPGRRHRKLRHGVIRLVRGSVGAPRRRRSSSSGPSTGHHLVMSCGYRRTASSAARGLPAAPGSRRPYCVCPVGLCARSDSPASGDDRVRGSCARNCRRRFRRDRRNGSRLSARGEGRCGGRY
jgi:hypothetical protein